MNSYKLIIFDVDGTLAERDTNMLLPGVYAWFEQHPDQVFALATNQGGVGLRAWMERDGFGTPTDYPDEPTIWSTMTKLVEQLPEAARKAAAERMYVCFAYQGKKSGRWAPTPGGYEDDHPLWAHGNRKPAPGMLLEAMKAASATPADTLMVGNDDEDMQAAEAAGCAFMLAAEFFGQMPKGDGCWLVTVHYDGFESNIIGIARTADGGKAAAADFLRESVTVDQIEWWQPEPDIWKADSGLPYDSLKVERFEYAEDLAKADQS